MNRDKLRKYINRLIMETFYAMPSGELATKEDLPDDFYKYQGFIGEPKPDEPGSLQSFYFDQKLAKIAKEQLAELYEDIGEEYISNAFSLMFGEDNKLPLKFNNTDLEIKLGDKVVKQIESGEFESGVSIIETLAPELGMYIRKIASATQNFTKTGKYKQARGGQLLRDDDKVPLAFGPSDVHPLCFLFSKPDPGKIGFGKTLIEYITGNLLPKMLSVENVTPVEFKDMFFPTYEKTINLFFNHIMKNNPWDERHPKTHEFERSKELYLEAISFVLVEYMAELSFESAYFGTPQPAKKGGKPQPVICYLPDKETLEYYIELVKKGEGYWMYQLPPGASIASGATRTTPISADEVYENVMYLIRQNLYYGPKFRDEPKYYDIKFTAYPAAKPISPIWSVARRINENFMLSGKIEDPKANTNKSVEERFLNS